MKYFLSYFLLVCFSAQAQLTNIASGQHISPGTNVSNVISGGGGGGCTPSYPTAGSLSGIIAPTSNAFLNGSQNPANLFDGTFDNVVWMDGVTVAGNSLVVHFTDSTHLVTEWRFTFSAAPNGQTSNWKWQGSNDGSTYSDIGASFQLTGGASAVVTDTSLSANTTQYSYYRLMGVSGTGDPGPYLQQIEPKICH